MERSRQPALQESIEDYVVASRRAALDSLTEAALDGSTSGPALLTGEAGSGKSWLRRRLIDRLTPEWRPIVVGVAPTHDGVDFLALLLEELDGSADDSNRSGALRIAVARILNADGYDGRRILLAVEDAHYASPAVWSEIEALCDGLGEMGALGAVVILGRTELAHRMTTRPLRGIASRIATHAHLPPLDVDEAQSLLPELDASDLERLHRDASGNPRRLLALAGTLAPKRLTSKSTIAPRQAPTVSSPTSPSRPVRPLELPPTPVARPDCENRLEAAPAQASSPAPNSASSVTASRPMEQPPLVPSRPPLRIEEGLIEVGWDGEFEEDEPKPNSTIEAEEPDFLEDDLRLGESDDEPVEDHYAALQAWSEWARNRDHLERDPDLADESVDESEVEPESEDEPVFVQAVDSSSEDVPPESDLESDEIELPGIGSHRRAENSHEHAPYSQLFTRLRQSAS